MRPSSWECVVASFELERHTKGRKTIGQNQNELEPQINGRNIYGPDTSKWNAVLSGQDCPGSVGILSSALTTSLTSLVRTVATVNPLGKYEMRSAGFSFNFSPPSYGFW